MEVVFSSRSKSRNLEYRCQHDGHRCDEYTRVIGDGAWVDLCRLHLPPEVWDTVQCYGVDESHEDRIVEVYRVYRSGYAAVLNWRHLQLDLTFRTAKL